MYYLALSLLIATHESFLNELSLIILLEQTLALQRYVLSWAFWSLLALPPRISLRLNFDGERSLSDAITAYRPTQICGLLNKICKLRLS